MPIQSASPSRAAVIIACAAGIMGAVTAAKSAAWARTRDRAEVNLLSWAGKIGVVLATLLMLSLGALAFYGIGSGQTHGAGEFVIATLIGLMFGLIGLWALINVPAMMGRHRLIFDRTGVVYQIDRGGVKPFAVRWDELASASVSTTEHQSRTNGSTIVRLDMTPKDLAAFEANHPEMAGIRHDAGYRLPLGPNESVINKVARALHTCAPELSKGIVDEGPAGPFTFI